MGILEVTDVVPDTFGLPEYKVSEMRGEIEAGGHDVRLLFGTKRFQQLNWLYTVVCSPQDLMRLSRECEALAVEAFNMSQIVDRRRAAGH